MKVSLLLIFCISFLLIPQVNYGQESEDHFKYAIRLTGAAQASYFSPYEDNFRQEEQVRWSGYSFGVTASKWISPHWDLGIGYYFSKQVGNSHTYDCLRVGPNPCPQSRGKVRFMKIPLSVGWYGIQKKRYSNKLSFGPQIQLLFSDPITGIPNYKKMSLGLLADWTHYFVINKQFDFVTGLRFDHSITNVDINKSRSRTKSLGVNLGINYNL